MADTSEAAINSALATLRQIHRRLQSIGELSELAATSSGPQRDELETDLIKVWYLQHRVQEAISGKVAVGGIILDNLGSELWRFYYDEFQHDWAALSELIDEVVFAGLNLDLEHGNADETPPEHATAADDDRGDPIDLAFSIGVDLVRNGFEDNYEWWGLQEEDVERAELLESASFFNPSEWSHNLNDLRPINARRPIRNHPAHVRIRLKEIGRSYILGNHLSVVALCRSLLEYALIDRSRSWGIEPYDTVNGQRRSRALWALIDEFETQIPALANRMETIRDHGNNAMHPSKHKDVVRFPEILKKQSLECVDAIRAVIEELYQ